MLQLNCVLCVLDGRNPRRVQCQCDPATCHQSDTCKCQQQGHFTRTNKTSSSWHVTSQPSICMKIMNTNYCHNENCGCAIFWSYYLKTPVGKVIVDLIKLDQLVTCVCELVILLTSSYDVISLLDHIHATRWQHLVVLK